MSRRQKILLAIAILILIAAIILALLLLRKPAEQPFTDTNTPTFTGEQPEGALPATGSNSTVTPIVTEQPVSPTPVAPPAPADDRNTLRNLASLFAERFGSYSNQGGYAGINDLKFFMTASLSDWSDTYVADLTANQSDPTLYAAVTTRALSATVEQFDEENGTASVRVKTQRQETAPGELDATIKYQDIVLGFIKLGDSWKVDDVRWQRDEVAPAP